MPSNSTRIVIKSPDQMAHLGRNLAMVLRAGDAVLVSGDLGAGKTLLCRHIIQAQLPVIEDIPSPSFAIIQTYDAVNHEIWHCDLYRLDGEDALWELGLDDAFETALCLIEWPNRLGSLRPKMAWEIQIDYGDQDDYRIVTIVTPTSPTIRTQQIEWFLGQTNWADADVEWMQSDASQRRYARLRSDRRTAILMDADPTRGEDVRPFLDIAAELRQRGVASPEIYAENRQLGLLVLQDFGDTLFDRVIADDPKQERPLYQAAISVLDQLQQTTAPDLPPYLHAEMVKAAAVVTEWYAPGPDPISAILRTALNRLDWFACAFTLRDYHAQNLIWRADEKGLDRLGVLDFQDAAVSHPVYDLVSLLFDARRDVSDGLRDELLTQAAQKSEAPADKFHLTIHTIAAQRNLRILGVFARLAKRDGKSSYIDLIPRVWVHLMQNLAHPELAALRAVVLERLPNPSDAFLQLLRDSCTD